MEIKNEEKVIFSNGMEGGQAFGVNMGPQLFQVMTSSLYKDKPRAVCRETLANYVDAHRERDFLFDGLDPSSVEYQALLDSGLAAPGTPAQVHVPTDVEPWFEVKDFGIGLPVDKIMGEVQCDQSGNVYRDANGHPIRSGGVYTTLFGSDKQQNNRAIGAYGLGCKSPYAISDVFQVISVVGGEEHRYIMYLDSQRSPKVDWLTKDSYGEPAPLPTDAKNGITVRIDAIPVSLKEKIRLSVSEILQTIPAHEQPIINDGMYKFQPMETKDIADNLKVVVRSLYGNIFYNSLVVNTGGVVYPLSGEKLNEIIDPSDLKMLSKVNDGNCIIVEMPLGSVNIPPSREEISYDDWSIGNIKDAIDPYVKRLRGELDSLIRDMPLTPFGMMRAINDLSKFVEREAAYGMVEAKVEESKEEIRKLGFTPVFRDSKLSYFSELPEGANYGSDFRCWEQDSYSVRSIAPRHRVIPDSYGLHNSVNVGRFVQNDGVVVLNDTRYTKSTIMGRFNKLELKDLLELFPYLENRKSPVRGTSCIHSLVICGSDTNGDFPGQGIPPLDHYEEIAMVYCRAGSFDYVLASEVCERFERIKKEKAKLASSVSLSELQRNVHFVANKTSLRYDGDSKLMTSEDGEPYFWFSESDWSSYLGVVDKYGCRTKLETALAKLGCARGRLLMIKGVRTISRKAVESNPERFIPLDFKKLEEIRIPMEIQNLSTTKLNGVDFMEAKAIGLDGVYSRILTNDILGKLLDKGAIGSVLWELSMIRHFPNKDALERLMAVAGTNHQRLVGFIYENLKFFGVKAHRKYERGSFLNDFGVRRRSVKFTPPYDMPGPEEYAKVGAIPPRDDMEVLRAMIILIAICGSRKDCDHLFFPSVELTNRDLDVFLGGVSGEISNLVRSIGRRFFEKYDHPKRDGEVELRKRQIEDVLLRYVNDGYPLGRNEITREVRVAIYTFNEAVKVVYPDLVIHKKDYTA